ncbi:MAG TPA: hypothetical protein VIN04_03305, partial [Myxococcota bacterium]
LWPFAQRTLVARFGMDPWKLAGFAMYAAPSLPVLVAVFVPLDGRLVLVDEATLPDPVRARLDRFRVERLALGRLREPEDVARALLAARPDASGIMIVVQRTDLDRRSARMVSADEVFSYDRSMLSD